MAAYVYFRGRKNGFWHLKWRDNLLNAYRFCNGWNRKAIIIQSENNLPKQLDIRQIKKMKKIGDNLYKTK